MIESTEMKGVSLRDRSRIRVNRRSYIVHPGSILDYRGRDAASGPREKLEPGTFDYCISS
jgi:hypothetical protein